MCAKSTLTLAAALAATALAPAVGARDATEDVRRVQITYRNLTAGQPFSTSVFIAHSAGAPPLFVEGQPASFELERLAEEGNVALLSSNATTRLDGAFAAVAIGLPVQPGGEVSVILEVTPENPLISGAFMLAHTNDGFAGIQDVDAFALTGPRTVELFAWDAGTENNNESGDDLIAMGGTERDPEHGTVRPHQGLSDAGDAPGLWKFDPEEPVAELIIEPVP